MDTKNKQSRRSFIGALAATGATTGLALIPNPSKANFRNSNLLGEANAADSMDAEKWINSLQGKQFPVVYDMHEHKDFWAGVWSNIYLMTNPDVKNIGIVIVMRHGGFPFALNDQVFAKYKLGEFFNIVDKNTGAPSVRNMYLEPTGKDYPLPGLDGIKVYSGAIAKARGLSDTDVYADLVNNVLPGIQVVPAGVWALGRLQQAPLSYGYINAG